MQIYLETSKHGYYHFITESVLFLLQEIKRNQITDCEIWHNGNQANLLQLFTTNPIKIIKSSSELPPNVIRTPVNQLCTVDDFKQMSLLKDIIDAKIKTDKTEFGITIIQRHQQRVIRNIQPLVEGLQYFGMPVRVVCFEKISLEERILVARNTKILIGVHGAGFTNMLFMLPGLVLEIMPKSFYWPFFEPFSRAFGHQYTFIEADDTGRMYPRVKQLLTPMLCFRAILWEQHKGNKDYIRGVRDIISLEVPVFEILAGVRKFVESEKIKV